MDSVFLPVENGQVLDRDRVPRVSFEELRTQALEVVGDGGKVVQFFVFEEDGALMLLVVLRTDQLLVASSEAPETFQSLSAEREAFHLFEREVAEQFGLVPEGHPWLKMVRYHSNSTGRPDVFGNDYEEEIPGRYDYYSVEGEEIHEVAVGPVHAGVIEPGHFRFNCIGERVLHLEIQLGYQHRGIEKMIPLVSPSRLPSLIAGVAGDTVVGHSLCFAQAIEALTDLRPDTSAQMLRTIGLELERIANHVGDLGALSGDVAFLPPANYCGRMRGDFLNMSLWLCGSRFGKGLVRPGGVGTTLIDEDRSTIKERIDTLRPQVEHVIDLIFSAPSVRARFDGCGVVSREDADHLGLVGPAGRASGLPYDVRRCFPTEHYAELEIPEYPVPNGDVHARARVRADEILQSISIIESLLDEPAQTHAIEEDVPLLPPSSFVVTVNEAWRGEVSHCLLTDVEGKIQRYKIKDPSFHNWNGLAMSLRDTGISDFPLNNKSFNLSYCGHDL
ncbi:MAG: hydrogenase [bacterium]|nr:hydrogenase [bacterium]